MSLFYPDGAWTWFNQRCAAYADGRYTVGSVKGDGKVRVAQRFGGSGVVAIKTVVAGFTSDDHVNPVITQLNSAGTNASKTLITYSEHEGAAYSYLSKQKYGVVLNAVVNRGGTTRSYSNVVQMGDSNYTIFDFYRTGTSGVGPHLLQTSTNGTTWATGYSYFDNSGLAPYFQVFRRSDTRIDFICTDGHPRDVVNNVYHFYLDLASNGLTYDLRKTDGTLIGNYNLDGTKNSGLDLPLIPANVTKIYDGTSTNSWLVDLCDIGGTLYAGIVTYTGGTGGGGAFTYRVGQLVSSTWTFETVCDGGGTANDYMFSSETHYPGGFAFDPADSTRLLVSRKYGAGDFRVELWTRDNAVWGSGAWSKSVDVSGNTGNMNVRPMWCKDAPLTQWFYLGNGTYSNVSTHTTGVYSYPDITVNTTYSAAAKPGSPALQSPNRLYGVTGVYPIYEGSGTTLHDLAAVPHNGTFVSTPAWGSDSYGPNLSGFSTTKYITIDPASQLLATGAFPFWIAALFKNTSTSQGVLFSQGKSSGDTPAVWIRTNTNGTAATVDAFCRDDASSAPNSTLASTGCNDGTYYVLIGVQWSATDLRVYLVGAPSGVVSFLEGNTSATSLGTTTDNQLTIGALRRSSVSLGFTGTLSLVAFGSADAPDPFELADNWLSGSFSDITPAATGQPTTKRMGGVKFNVGPYGLAQGIKGW